MGIILTIIAYIVYAAFCCRFISHALVWYKAAKQAVINPFDVSKTPPSIYAVAVIDVIFFRRLFSTNKLLWIGSWTFHISFLLVILRHLRFFMEPVPACITYIQPFGLVAGYILPLSLVYIFILRLSGKDRYVSYYNFFILGIVFCIGITGLLMRNFFMADVVDVKEFVFGILTFRLGAAPKNFLFIMHFLLVLLLIPYLPLHIFTAPVVTLEARRREETLDLVIHEK